MPRDRSTKPEQWTLLPWVIPVGPLVVWQFLGHRPQAGRTSIPTTSRSARSTLSRGSRCSVAGEHLDRDVRGRGGDFEGPRRRAGWTAVQKKHVADGGIFDQLS